MCYKMAVWAGGAGTLIFVPRVGAAGLIRTTPGNIADYDQVRADIRELAEKYEIKEIGYDRWRATQLVTQLTGDGLTMIPIGQGFASMSAPSPNDLASVQV